MDSCLLQKEADIQLMRDLIRRLPDESTVVDFEEAMLLASVRSTTRLWQRDDRLIGFAYVDDYNNLKFATDPDYVSARLEREIVEWGATCMKKRNAETGQDDTLDACCSATDRQRMAMLEKYGFTRESLRSLHYARSLGEPIADHAFPQGFSLRCVEGEHEVERLTALHRAAFGTENMTVEQRLAIMRAPNYERELDFVAVAPDGELAAFCICGFEEDQDHVGYTDPIGTHPRYQRLGLGKAIVTAGLRALKTRGAKVAEVGTSSENIAMQRLAETLGFVLVSESVWFSKKTETASYLYTLIPSPFGEAGIVWREVEGAARVYRVALSNERATAQALIQSVFRDLHRASHPAITGLGERIRCFLTGEAIAFDLDSIALETCSDFQQRVLRAEHAIPRGWVSTYGRIAAHLGVSGGARAVGRALATNPFPLIIPCHRAIQASGAVGGFQGGTAMKRALLEFEGVPVSQSGKVLTSRVYY